MDLRLIVFVLTGAVFRAALAQTRQYYFVNTQLNWTDAQSLCRRDYTDLATIEKTADLAIVNTSNFTGKAWIGLFDDWENSWRWSINDSSFYGEGETAFRNWFSHEPNNVDGSEYCGELVSGSSGLWNDNVCKRNRLFVCYNGTVNYAASFVIPGISLNWTDSQKYCRENYVDLVSIRNQTENTIITNLANGANVWIGLYGQRQWSDGSHSLFQHWVTGQPNSNAEQCIAAGFSDSGRWSDEDCSLTFPSICYITVPPNADVFVASSQNDSITLQWTKVNDNISFVLQFNGAETNIRAPDGDGPVTHTISSLSAATQYTFTLFSVFKNVSSSGVQLTAATAPQNPEGFRPLTQVDSSITLQWDKVNNNISFVLQFNGTETNIRAPDGDGPVNHTISSLSAATQYTFTLFSVFENVSSSGVQLTAATAPQNPEGFRPLTQLDSSVTLQWDKVNNDISFVLQFNGAETNIRAPDGDGPVTHTVSSLSAATQYTFTLFSVFENVRSTGVNITAVTGPSCAQLVCPSGTDCISTNGKPQCIDPCETYTVLNDEWRSINNRHWTFHWDRYINWQGWYRLFLGQTSAEMPDRCIEAYRCGTLVPLWITEPHPTQSNEIESRTVCSAWISSCCYYPSHTIQVKRCYGYYYVYKLVRPPTLYVGYCAAPQNIFRSLEQNETSITLQWDIVNNSLSFVLQFNGTETNISVPDGDGPVTHTVSSLTAATQYTFIFFSVFENNTRSGIELKAVTAPLNAKGFRSSDHNETSITLQWTKINSNISFVLQFNGTETNISAPDGDGPVTHTVSSLTAQTQYTFTLFSVFENLRSTGVNITAATAPQNPEGFRPLTQLDSSINLQWDKVNDISFVLQFNGAETNIRAPDGDGPVTHIVSSLSAATQYTFTLFSVFENLRSTGVNITAVTAPLNAKGFRSSDHNETSITLQWTKINSNISFVLQFNGTETNISAPDGDGPVTHTVSSLTAQTQYTFTLFSVFENLRSTGVNITAATGKIFTC
ncbi:uncharacterized protein LOC133463927 isoform X2 [Cololabis saira]|uniref:uncharacterized protein LOC133463927 isoform X2 n=1 Tax=Cololabis saira TaxID=129043 RepID=UPI002AD2D4DD|nr:uncharacterized protein LOC133463927 isoform X2 [Cololabis saira]